MGNQGRYWYQREDKPVPRIEHPNRTRLAYALGIARKFNKADNNIITRCINMVRNGEFDFIS